MLFPPLTDCYKPSNFSVKRMNEPRNSSEGRNYRPFKREAMCARFS